MSLAPENHGHVDEDVKGALVNSGLTVHGAAPHGSGQDIDDFSSYCEGDLEPTLNKRIRTLILCDEKYIVYLSDDFSVEWSISTNYGAIPQGSAEIENRIAHLETVSTGRLRAEQGRAFARLLGEAMARLLAENDLATARQSLDYAEAYLDARSTENARVWYLQTAYLLAFLAAVAGIVLWMQRSTVRAFVGEGAFDLLLGSAFGAVGALLSMLIRVRKLDVDAAAGPHIHKLESGARIAVGSIGALAVGLGVKANLLFGFASGRDRSLAALLGVCLVAGASERIVPGFIKQIEDTVSGNRRDKKGA